MPSGDLGGAGIAKLTGKGIVSVGRASSRFIATSDFRVPVLFSGMYDVAFNGAILEAAGASSRSSGGSGLARVGAAEYRGGKHAIINTQSFRFTIKEYFKLLHLGVKYNNGKASIV